MTNQPANQHKQTATGQPTPITHTYGSPSGSPPPASSRRIGNRGRWVRRVLAAIIGWIYIAIVAAGLLSDASETINAVVAPIAGRFGFAFVKNADLRSFVFLVFVGWTATFVVFGLSSVVDTIENIIQAIEAIVVPHIKFIVLSAVLMTVVLGAYQVIYVRRQPGPVPPPPPTLTPTPIPTSTPTRTPTPTATSKPATVNSPVVLCASNAAQQPIEGNVSSEIPPDGFVSLDRYNQNLTLKSLVDKLYPGFTYPINIQSCKDEKQLVSTSRLKNFDESQQIVFHNPLETLVPVKEIWVLLSASNTVAQSDPLVGEISARFAEGGSTRRLADLTLGKNIADWTFGGAPIGGTNEELPTKTDFQANPPQGIDVNPGDSSVRRVLVGSTLVSAPGSDKVVERAAQLLAVRLPVEAVFGSALSPLSVMIRDRVGGAGIDVLAVVLIPADFTLTERTSPTILESEPVCLSQVANGGGGTWSSRNFDEDVKLPEQTYQIKTGCGKDTAVYIPEIDPGVSFYFDKILATQAAVEPENPYYSTLTLKIPNSIQATHLYLLLAARNLCVATATTVGSIDLGVNGVDGSDALTAGINVRQGRTNVSQDDCKSGEDALSIGDPSEQPSSLSQLIGVAGIPLRAKPNDRTADRPAELWLDLVKVPLPKDRSTVTLKLNNALPQTLAGNEPFFTVYGAALVREQP